MDKVCRICLKKRSQHKEIENILLLEDYLDDLLVSLDTSVFQKSIVCKKCVANIHELFDFKTLCLNTEDSLLPYIEENDSKVAQLDLRSVYSKIKLRDFPECQFPEFEENEDICRLCFKITTQWVPLETAISQTNVRDAFENNLPEISLQAIKHPRICEYCLRMLNSLNSFTSQCKNSINIMRVNGSVENLTVETVIDLNEARDEDNEVKVKIQLVNQVENQVHKLLADEVENHFGNQFDSECKIEIKENPIDYVQNDVERFAQSISDSEGSMKKEENCDISQTKESNLSSTAPRDMLGINLALENSSKPIPCENCPNIYFSHVYLGFHSIEHSQDGMYSCHICKNYANSDRNNMVVHIRAHEEKGICEESKESCIKTGFVQIISDSEGYKKGKENDELSKTKELGIHIPLTSSSKPISCDNCLNIYFSHVDLTYHSIEHSQDGMYSCHICKNYANSDRNNMVVHIRAHEEKRICEETVTSKETKKLSINTDHSCTFCVQTFDTEEDLRSHLRMHTEDKPHICWTCGKGFYKRKSLTSHMHIHTVKNKSHICSHCGKGFYLKSRLTVHLNYHTGEKPHICSHCGKRFISKRNLTFHLFSHTAEKPHICSHCGKGFPTKSHLNRHLITHKRGHSNRRLYTRTGQKSHICSRCGKGFTRKTRLNDHLFTHTGGMPHICSYCGKGFKKESYLNRHHISTHAGKMLQNHPS